jgi:hypothetical protein
LTVQGSHLAQPLRSSASALEKRRRDFTVCICIAHKEEVVMLWTIFVILLVLWLVGIVSSYTLGGFIHLLLVIALVVLLLNLISGRRPVV